MAMLGEITHTTSYRYAKPVTFGTHRAMFLPRRGACAASRKQEWPKRRLPAPRCSLPLPRFRKMLRQKIRQHLDAGGARAAGRGDEMHRALGLMPAFQDHLDLA